MRTFIFASLVVVLLTFSFSASAWDEPSYWYDPAQGKPAMPFDVMPGGEGIIGTGGVTDHNITCAHCHAKGADNYGTISVEFNPPLPLMYTPNKVYTITAVMKGEHLGMSGCSPDVKGNLNQFAATFENQAGKVAGSMRADYGDSASCPADPPPAMGFTGSMLLYKDCRAVISNNVINLTSWNFTWTAPPPGTGPVTMYYGAVDGDCMMDSMKDDTEVGTVRMAEGTAALMKERKPDSDNMLAYAFLFPVVGLAGMVARRRPPAVR